METLLIMLLMPLSVFAGRPQDPAPGVWWSRAEARNLECRRMTQARAHEQFPARVPEPAPRGSLSEIDALICTPRIMAPGERSARDEVILSTLGQSVGEIAEVAAAVGQQQVTWHVDAFYPEPRVASKIAVAARTHLAERGNKVSDKVPVLAAGDLSVLGRMKPKDAYPLACARYFAQQVLNEKDAFLGIMIVDERETQLHAGVCLGGKWSWLQ